MNLLDIAIAKKMGGGGGSEPVIESLSVTENGTYEAPSGVDGYNPITVNVSGGGGGGDVTLVVEKNVAVSTTSEASVQFDTITVNKSELNDKAVFIDIQDTNGPRANHFYGWQVCKLINPGIGIRGVGGTYYKGDNLTATAFGNASGGAYGVFADITSNASEPDVYKIVIMGRYDSSRSTTIDGLFKVRIITLPAMWA